MDIEDYKKENAEFHQRVADLEKANNELIIHNIQLGKKVDAYADTGFDVLLDGTSRLECCSLCTAGRLLCHQIVQPQIPRCLRHDPTRIPHTYRFAPHS